MQVYIESITIAGVGVAQTYQIARIFRRTPAGTDGMVSLALRHVFHIAARNVGIVERLIAGIGFLISQVFFAAAPEAIGLIAPDGVQRITFQYAYSTGPNTVLAIVAHHFVIAVAQIEAHLIKQVLETVAVRNFKFPSPCLQCSYISRRHRNARNVRQSQVGKHVVVLLPVIVGSQVQPVVEQP